MNKTKKDQTAPSEKNPNSPSTAQKEVGGRQGPDPTRFGDWEKNGRCIDF
ncbi:MAG: succinate dehydrogenase assembly factor 4 [Rhodospirillaceae bacterium]